LIPRYNFKNGHQCTGWDLILFPFFSDESVLVGWLANVSEYLIVFILMVKWLNCFLLLTVIVLDHMTLRNSMLWLVDKEI